MSLRQKRALSGDEDSAEIWVKKIGRFRLFASQWKCAEGWDYEVFILNHHVEDDDKEAKPGDLQDDPLLQKDGFSCRDDALMAGMTALRILVDSVVAEAPPILNG